MLTRREAGLRSARAELMGTLRKALDPIRFVFFASMVLAVTSCTYGPAEEDARITHLIRLGDSYRAVVMVQQEVLQRPTGSLNTFPNGGRLRFLERRVFQFLIDARERSVDRLASQEAPDSLWESFAAYVGGVEGDSAVYVRLVGCPRGPECHDALEKTARFRLTVSGRVTPVERVPSDAPLPGSMGSRAPGEMNYVRFGTSGDTITVKLEDGGPYRPMFVLRRNGSITTIGG